MDATICNSRRLALLWSVDISQGDCAMIETATQTVPRDLFYGSAIDTFRFSPSARAAADAILAKDPVEIFSALVCDQESEGALLACKHVLDATLATMDPTK